ncbi:MAG: 50S ribosomal protein L25 [Chloroflexota bacterium]
MADLVEIKASHRVALGKKVKALRRDGLVPANVYGRSRDSLSVQLNDREIEHLLATHSRSQVVSVVVDGQEEPALISAVQRHPTRQHVLHVDFQRVSLDQPVQVNVQLSFVGDSPAVRHHDAVIVHNLSEVIVEGLPGAIPSEIDVDVSALVDPDSAIYVRDLSVGRGLQIMSDPDELVAKAMHSTIQAETTEPSAEATAEA